MKKLRLLLLCFLIVQSPNIATATGTVKLPPQNPFLYIEGDMNEELIDKDRQNSLYKSFRDHFFSPWDQKKSREADDVIRWVFEHYGSKDVYGENKQPRSREWIENQRESSNISEVNSLSRRAIAIRPTSLRLMPSERPLFLSFDLPGEGYPFDYLQNSLVHGGEPLFVSHLSKDRLWAWCDTSYASGWISLEDIAWISEKDIAIWRQSPLASVIREGLPLVDDKGRGLFKAKVGSILPITRRGIWKMTLIVPTSDENGGIVIKETIQSRQDVAPMPLTITPWHIAKVSDQMIGEPYGWGGYLKDRDCSSTTRDIMAPFGIWLPRNSRAQALEGRTIALAGLSRDKKESLISKRAKPFISLIGQPGHIMLYIGKRHEKPLILHNMWGVKTKLGESEGRFIVGKCVISGLDVGSNLTDLWPRGLIIDRIDTLAILD